MSLFKSIFKGVAAIVKPVIVKPVAKIISTLAPLVPSIKLPTESQVSKWFDTQVNKASELIGAKVDSKIGEWVNTQVSKIGDIKIGNTTLGETGLGKFVSKGVEFLDEVITPKVDKFIVDSGEFIANNIVSPIMDFACNITDKLANSVNGSNSNNLDTSNITIPNNQGIGIVEPANTDVVPLTNTTTKQVSTSNKESLKKVSEILNSKNDSSFDYQKFAKIIDSNKFSDSVKGQSKSNLGYNQYEKMQDLVSTQEQVSRYQEIEQQVIENKILDQQPSEDQVINHQILELQYQ